jgi:VWFA-related protein
MGSAMKTSAQYVAVLFAMSVLVATARVSAQEPAEPRFKASTTAVVVDVVVRDKQQRPVAGLTADDFTVLEDGKKQPITSFVAVSGPSKADNAEPHGAERASATTAAHRDDPPFVAALVFEQLGLTANSLAVKAASRLIRQTIGPSGFAGLFTIDHAVHPVVSYTNDLNTLDKGLKTVSMTAGIPAFDSAAPLDPTGAYFRMHATLDSLGAVIASLEHLPGRKTVIFFSEGLATADWLQDNRRDHFLRVMAQANRSHVAFYTFDAAGLRIASTVGAGEAAPYVGLQTMADETGGAFVDSTNDLNEGIDRVTADLHQYYLLGYVSGKQPDDRYRTIEVKVRGKDLTVLARKGYRASKGPDLAVVTAPEVAPLLLLDRAADANDVPMRAGTLRVATADSQNRTVLLARVPLSALTFDVAREGAKPTARLTIVARVKDGKSQVVQYAAQTYDLTGQAGLTQPGAGDVLFYRDVTLPAGRLNLEFVAFDAKSQLGSIQRMPLDVTQTEPKGLRAGDLIVAHKLQRRAGPGTAAASAMPALQFGDLVVLPNLGEPLSPDSDLVFAFEAFAEAGAGATSGGVTVMQDGHPASASVTLQLLPAKDSGRITYVGHIPIGMLAPATYDLLLTLRQGTMTLTRTTPFTVQSAVGQ